MCTYKDQSFISFLVAHLKSKANDMDSMSISRTLNFYTFFFSVLSDIFKMLSP